VDFTIFIPNLPLFSSIGASTAAPPVGDDAVLRMLGRPSDNPEHKPGTIREVRCHHRVKRSEQSLIRVPQSAVAGYGPWRGENITVVTVTVPVTVPAGIAKAIPALSKNPENPRSRAKVLWVRHLVKACTEGLQMKRTKKERNDREATNE
jgi:hypothetical protein